MIARLHLLLALALLLASAAPLPASEIREKVAGFARDIARLIKDEKQTQVAVGEFSGPPVPKTSAGPSIQLALIEELKKLKVGVNDDAFIVVKGEYSVLDDKKKQRADLTLRLVVTIRDTTGKKIDELQADVGYRGNEDLVKVLSLNADLSRHTKANREDANEQLKKQLANPPLFLDGTRVRVSATSPFAVEVLTRPAGGGALKVIKPSNVKGQAFAPIKKGEEYVLRLHNTSKFEAAVTVTIDGVDAFQFFEPADKRPTSFIVAPGKTRTISGWRRSTELTNAFLVGSFSESAAARALRSNAKVGTITVCFHPCWTGATPPDYEGARGTNENATTLGREIKEKTTIVRRTIGPLLAAISIRYNK